MINLIIKETLTKKLNNIKEVESEAENSTEIKSEEDDD